MLGAFEKNDYSLIKDLCWNANVQELQNYQLVNKSYN